MLDLEHSDLANAYAMIMMRLDEHEELGIEEYFKKHYDVDIEQLADFFAKFISTEKFSIESAFRAFHTAYELGRTQERVSQETPLLVE